jgi:hypothetical protein
MSRPSSPLLTIDEASAPVRLMTPRDLVAKAGPIAFSGADMATTSAIPTAPGRLNWQAAHTAGRIGHTFQPAADVQL